MSIIYNAERCVYIPVYGKALQCELVVSTTLLWLARH